METLLNQIPRMLSGNELKEAMSYYPNYEVGIRNADAATRLLSLSDVYQIYIPTNMSVEIYSKIYLTMIRSLQKKNSKESAMQLTANYQAMHGTLCRSKWRRLLYNHWHFRSWKDQFNREKYFYDWREKVNRT